MYISVITLMGINQNKLKLNWIEIIIGRNPTGITCPKDPAHSVVGAGDHFPFYHIINISVYAWRSRALPARRNKPWSWGGGGPLHLSPVLHLCNITCRRWCNIMCCCNIISCNKLNFLCDYHRIRISKKSQCMNGKSVDVQHTWLDLRGSLRLDI